VVCGVVEQFGEGVAHQAVHLGRQFEEGGKVLPPGQVFLQRGQRVALHHLAQSAGLVAGVAALALHLQPLRSHQRLELRVGCPLGDAQALHQVLGQVFAVLDGGGGDPQGQR
jgi:hypothetical protein